MKIEQTKTSELIPYANNAKLHSDEQIKKIAASIKEFGFNNPVLIDKDNGIIAGHGRVLAAGLLKLKDVPCIRLRHLTEAQKKAYIIADNRLGDIGGGWNEELLKVELEGLKELDFNINLTGFDDSFLSFVEEPTEGLIEDDEIPEVTEPRVKLGEVWQLGNHRLLCGDCTDRHNVERLMNGKKADLVFTDPPYDLPDCEYCENIEKFTQDAHIFIMHDDKGIVDYLRKSKLLFMRFFVCNFGFSSPRGNDSYLQHILISHEHNGAPIKHQNHFDGFSSIIKIEYRHRLKDDPTGHKHQKPINLISSFLEHYSVTNDIVLDVFGGSGSTLIACEKLNRTCYMMELSPEYCDVIINRWEKFTGETAVKC